MTKRLEYILFGLLAVVMVAGVFYMDGRYRAARAVEAEEQFRLLGTLRHSALKTYIETVSAEIAFWSMSDRIDASMHELTAGWQALGDDPGAQVQNLYIPGNSAGTANPNALDDADDGSEYSKAHANLHPFAREFVTERGYYDFFLIDLDGNIIYSVEKEFDFGSNLLTGPYSNSGLANVFRRVVADETDGKVILSDFMRYAPSGGAPAIFAGEELHDADGNHIGVLALQLPSATIADIMRFTTGMGESGETYLVGSDLLMRSDSRFSDTPTMLKTRVDTETVRLALSGESGIAYTPDYRGVMVLSAYDYVDFDGVRWAVMAEIDAEEVSNSVGNILTMLSAAATALFGLLLVTVVMLRDLASPETAGLAASMDLDIDAG
jgi:methyl-accepting chemotaxis protein